MNKTLSLIREIRPITIKVSHMSFLVGYQDYIPKQKCLGKEEVRTGNFCQRAKQNST